MPGFTWELSKFLLCPLDAYTSTKPADWRAVLGEHHLVDKEVFEQSRGVEAIYLHPKYKSMFLEGIFDTPPDYDVGKLHFVVPKPGSRAFMYFMVRDYSTCILYKL